MARTETEETALASSSWDLERTTRLQSLYCDGVSFRDIAAEIGVTRNAVIGKIHRMKLEPRDTITIKKKVPVIKARRHRPPKVTIVKKPLLPEPDPSVDYRCEILELTDTRCRFPLWRHDASPYSDRFYCGAPGAELSAGQPYCRKHARLCNPQQQ